MTEPAVKHKKTETLSVEPPFLSDKDIEFLMNSMLAPYAELDRETFIRICQKTRLDPFTKQIWIRPEKQGSDRGVILAGIQGFLSVADRSGLYDGSDPIQWCAKDGQWVDVWTPDENPVAARATAYRQDHTRPEVAVVKWNAVAGYYTDRSSGRRVPTDFWKRMPDYMLGKCALAAALRKLFPSLLTGVYESNEIPEAVETSPEPAVSPEKQPAEKVSEPAKSAPPQQSANGTVQERLASALSSLNPDQVFAFLIDRKKLKPGQPLSHVPTDYCETALAQIDLFREAITAFDFIPMT